MSKSSSYSSPPEKVSQVSEPDMSGSYTVADYLCWQFEGWVELLRGKIHRMSPAPRSSHQRMSTRLLQLFFQAGQTEACEIFHEPFDVYLFADSHMDTQALGRSTTVVQPDLAVICDPAKIREIGCLGAPDFIIEIVSPSTRRKDLGLKRELYQEAAVPEIWYVDSARRHILTLRREGGTYLEATFAERQTVAPRRFPAFRVCPEEVFKAGAPEGESHG